MRFKDSVIYDPTYFSGPCGVYYSVTHDKIYWLKRSEELIFFDREKVNLIRIIVYDFENGEYSVRKGRILNPPKGLFIRLDEGLK